jgi:hypothetical protein
MLCPCHDETDHIMRVAVTLSSEHIIYSCFSVQYVLQMKTGSLLTCYLVEETQNATTYGLLRRGLCRLLICNDAGTRFFARDVRLRGTVQLTGRGRGRSRLRLRYCCSCNQVHSVREKKVIKRVVITTQQRKGFVLGQETRRGGESLAHWP